METNERQFKPMPGTLIIQPVQPETRTPGGIEIPKGAQAAEPKGIVLKVGAQCQEGLRVGDRVVYQRYAAKELPGTEAMIVPEREVLAVIDDGTFTLNADPRAQPAARTHHSTR